MVTLKDIAREAGVSITTVSNVVHNRASRVSPEMVAQIRAIMEREHYVPSMTARTLANSRSLIVGVINHLVPRQSGGVMADPFHNTFMAGIEQQTREEGYFLMLRSVEDSLELEKLRQSWSMDGMIFTGLFQDDFLRASKIWTSPLFSLIAILTCPMSIT